MSTFYTLLTTVGLAKLANAQALGTVVQWSQMAVGDGNGNPTTPSEAQTALVRERYRASLNQLTTDPENPNYLIAEMIIPATVGGWTVHEIGIFDADGDMVAVANCPASYKPVLAEGSTTDLVIRVIVQLSNTASVQLKIDPAVVLASRKWVIDNYVERTKLAGGTTSQVLRKKSNADLDVEWADPLSAVQVLVTSVEETQTLATAQTIVDLATVTTQGCAVYIEGVRLRPDQFARTTATRITLGQAYPSGSKITIVQNEEASGVAASESEAGLIELATAAEVAAGTDQQRAVVPLQLAKLFPLRGTAIYSTAGSFTWNVPAGVTKVLATVIGGGGGGGSAVSNANYNAAGGGGGGGGFSRELIDLAGASSVSVVVGAGGAGGIAGGAIAQLGGASSFGAYCSATGGFGGNGATAAAGSTQVGAGGAGGTGAGGYVNGNGLNGHGGIAASPAVAGGSVGAGAGGGSFISGPGACGAGGNGGSTTVGSQSINGSPGSAGVVIIEW